MLSAFVRNLIGLVVGFFALPSCLDLLIRVGRHCDRWPPDALGIGLGALAGLLAMVLRRPNWLFHTFIHELCHFLACLALGVRVERFVVTNGKGGEVHYIPPGDPFRGTLISIAPYVLPLFLLPIALARFLVGLGGEGPWREVLSGLVAFAFLTHLHGLYHNIRLNFLPADGDLAKTGRLLSLVLITASLLPVTTGVLWVLWLPAAPAAALGGSGPAGSLRP